MRSRQPIEQASIVQYFAKEFARFLNRVENDETDILGSFLIENEWERYIEDGKDVVQSLELAGFVILPMDPTDAMVAAADSALADGLMGQRGVRLYVTAVFGAMLRTWVEQGASNLVIDIISMALSRASSPKSRRDAGFQDGSFQRFRKQSLDILSGLDKTGHAIAPEDPTPDMVSSGVSETAEHKSRSKEGINIGADPKYLISIYQNMVEARPK